MEPPGVRIASSDVEPALREARVVCGVCARQLSKYGCPRCNARTCSLECYKAHSKRCTEEFARDNTLQAMKGLRVEDGERQRFAGLLRRVHDAQQAEGHLGEESGSEEEEREGDPRWLSDSTLERLAASQEPSLEQLTPDERRAFLRAVGSGGVSNLLEPWQPWWWRPEAPAVALRSDGTALVQALAGEACEEEPAATLPVPPAQPLPPLCSLLPGRPSPLLPCHCAEVLGAYCCVLRCYNGDWAGDQEGAAQLLLSLSPVLHQASRSGPAPAAQAAPVTTGEALRGVSQRARAPGLGDAVWPHAHATAADAARLSACGRGALVCALEHARRLVERAAGSVGAAPAATLRRAERKLFFLTAWANEGDAAPRLADSLAPEAAGEEAQRAAAAAQGRASGTPQQTETPKGVLLREL